MNKLNSMVLLTTLVMGAGACSSDDKKTDGQDQGQQGSEAFAACMADVTDVCDVTELDTGEKINATACKAMKMVPIPLTAGGNYGPKTIPGGPYGGRTMWNQGLDTEFANEVNPSEPLCLPGGVETFKEPASVNAEILNTRGLDYKGYTIFRPACMKDGETYPVITWANGTCGLTHGYSGLLGTVASYGFVIIASNSTWTATKPTNAVQARAIDYAEFLNEDSTSELYHKLDLDHVGAMGHSQGAAATLVVAADARVKSIIAWNGGSTNLKPFLYVSGDRDVGGTQTPASLATATTGATQPGAWIYYHQVLETGGSATGHLVLMEQPDRVVDMAVAWWKWQLKDDAEAKKFFVGSDCTLCNRASEFDFGVNSSMQ